MIVFPILYITVDICFFQNCTAIDNMFKNKLDISVNGESKKVIFIDDDQNSVINYLFFNGYTK